LKHAELSIRSASKNKPFGVTTKQELQNRHYKINIGGIMNKMKLFALAVLPALALGSSLAVAQDNRSPEQLTPQQPVPSETKPVSPGSFKPQGRIIVPLSSNTKGVHTNTEIFVPAGRQVSTPVPDFTFAETPASIGCVYNVEPITLKSTGCNASTLGNHEHPSGGWGAIAVVDAFDDPNITSDLAFFDQSYGLPAANVTVVYANSSFGTLGGGFGPSLTASCSGVPQNGNFLGWDLEESLDAEWAHVMAPSAKIIVVEACTQNLEDLLYAEVVAGIEVSNAGGGDISNSWGYPESCVGNDNCGEGENGGPYTQVQDDNFLYRYYWSEITYFASAGDSGSEVLFPSASPWVVSVGGTTINRDSSGNFQNESCWSDSGGGPSAVEAWQSPPNIEDGMGPWSAYQYPFNGQSNRTTPDISFDADPNSGVYVYDTDGTCDGFCIVGGTSVGSPSVAGLVNSSNNRLGQAPAGGGSYATTENNFLYSQLFTHTAYPANFYDVTTGSNGHAAGPGYDECTGIGSPRGHLGK
jgi:kumamolisin